MHGGAAGAPAAGIGGWSTFSNESEPADVCKSFGSCTSEDGPIWSLPEALVGVSEEQCLELLLDDVEIAHEFRIGNPKVQEKCATVATATELVRYVTVERPVLSEEALRRRPFVAAELLSSERMLDVLLEADASDPASPAAELWSFLDSSPGPEMAHLFAGYFGAVAAALFLRRQAYTAEVLRVRGPAAVVAGFAQWLEMRSCVELLALLICTDGPVQLVLPFEAVLDALLEVLRRRGASSPVACEHAALLLDALLTRALVPGVAGAAQSDALLERLTSRAVLTALADALADPQEEAAAASTAAGVALSSLLEQLFALPAHALLPNRSFEHRLCAQEGVNVWEPLRGPPRSPPRAAGACAPGEDNDEVVITDESLNEILDPAGGPEGRLEACGTVVVEELCSRLDALCGRLPGQAGGSSSSSSSSGGSTALAPWDTAAVVPEGTEIDEALRLVLRLRSDDTVLLSARLRRLAALAGVSTELQQLLACGPWASAIAAVEAAERQPGDAAEDTLHWAAADARAATAETLELVRGLRALSRQRRAILRHPAGLVRCPGGYNSTGTAVEVLRVLTGLAQTRRRDVFCAFLQAGVLRRCIAALLSCRWSSLLHNALAAVVLELARAGELGVPLLLQLLDDRTLMGHVIRAYGAGRTRRGEPDGGAAATEPGAEAPRSAEPTCPGLAAAIAWRGEVGFLGPLHCICAELETLSQVEPQVAAALSALEGWAASVVPEVVNMESLTADPLGGSLPEPMVPGGCDFDCLAVVRKANRELVEEVDLSLEDLRDVNEELEIAELADMADRQRKRRQRAAAARGVKADLSDGGDDEQDEQMELQGDLWARRWGGNSPSEPPPPPPQPYTPEDGFPPPPPLRPPPPWQAPSRTEPASLEGVAEAVRAEA